MSVFSRLIISSQRFASTKHKCQNVVVRHFQRKSNKVPSSLEPAKLEFSKDSVPVSHVEHNLPKYFIYTAAFVPSVFVGCMIWQYENYRQQAAKKFRRLANTTKEFGLRDHLNSLWNQFSPGKKVVIGIIAANIGVLGLWRIPACQNILKRYFLCMPVKGYSVLGATLCGFSHQAYFHAFCNLYVLWSFSAGLMTMLNYEQVVAVYLSGITISSLTSCMYRVATKRIVPSLGASGGIMTLIAILCYASPDSKISIAFVDQIIPHSFSASSAIKGIMLIDALGLVFRWRLFDHAAHLGGALFGLFYAAYGKTIIWDNYRKPILKWWHKTRNESKNE